MKEEEKLTRAEQTKEQAPEERPPEEQTSEQEQNSAARRHSVFPYLAILFGTAFLLLLFAYLMQQRDSEETRGYLLDLRESMGSIQSIDQLVEENQALREENEGLKGQVSGLEQERDDLKNELEISNGIISVRDFNQQETWNIISALDTMARIRTLYEEEQLDAAREILTALPQKEGTDEVEYYLNVYKQKAIGIADPELYDPLTEWQELKNALAEEEDAG